MEFDELIRTQTQLIKQIQAGEDSLLPELWSTVHRFVRSRAYRYHKSMSLNQADIEVEELVNASYIAMVSAVKSYDLEKGYLFANWLLYYCRKEWRKLYGFDSFDLHQTALSLDAPINDADGEITLGDSIQDVTALSPEEAAEQADGRAWLKGAVDELLSELPTDSESIMRASFILEKSVAVLCKETGLPREEVYKLKNKGLNKLRAMTRHTPLGRKIREYYKGTVKFRHIGLTEFTRTYTSEQELYILNLERAEKKAFKQLPFTGLEPPEIIALTDYRDNYYPGIYSYLNKH